MRHFAQIAELRRKGWKPLHVTLSDQPTPGGGEWWKWSESLPFPIVEIERGDDPESLDLRALVGLPVLIDIPNRPRFAARLATACTRGGAIPLLLGQPAEVY